MTIDQLLKNKTGEFQGIVDFYDLDIASIRTGRATPSLIENIRLTMYEQQMAIKELAAITVPEPRMLVIQPWDKKNLDAIRAAISKSDIGISPSVDGDVIRLIIPQMTEERRKEYTKTLKQKTEETRIKIRRLREEIWGDIQKMEKNGEIREDDKFAGKDKLQKKVDEYNGKIEKIEKDKERELLTV